MPTRYNVYYADVLIGTLTVDETLTRHRYDPDPAGLAVESGKRFGNLGEGFLRVNLACPRCFIDDAVAVLKKVLFPA